MTGMDTVSWLSFFTASGLGAALGVLSLTGAGGLPVSESPRARRLAILAAALGCVLVLQYGGGALLEERGLFWRGWVQTALSLTRGRAGCPPAGRDHPGPGGALPGERLGDSGVRPGLCGGPAGGGRLHRSGACGKRRERTGGPPGGRDPGGPGCGSAPPGGLALCKFVRAWRAPGLLAGLIKREEEHSDERSGNEEGGGPGSGTGADGQC